MRTTTNIKNIVLPANNDIIRRIYKATTYIRIGTIRKDKRKYLVIITDYIIPQKLTKIITIDAHDYKTAVSILNKYVPISNV